MTESFVFLLKNGRVLPVGSPGFVQYKIIEPGSREELQIHIKYEDGWCVEPQSLPDVYRMEQLEGRVDVVIEDENRVELENYCFHIVQAIDGYAPDEPTLLLYKHFSSRYMSEGRLFKYRELDTVLQEIGANPIIYKPYIVTLVEGQRWHKFWAAQSAFYVAAKDTLRKYLDVITPEDLLQTSKTIDGVVCIEEGEELKFERKVDGVWTQVNLDDLEDPDEIYYVCVKLTDGSHLPVPILAQRGRDHEYRARWKDDLRAQAEVVELGLKYIRPLRRAAIAAKGWYARNSHKLKTRPQT